MILDVQLRARILFAGMVVVAMALTASAEPAELEDRVADFDGVNIHYQVSGEGETTVVLIHGWAGGVWVWEQQLEGLADRARVIAIDLPGHGESDKPKIDYTIGYFARSVAAVLDDAGVDKAVLIGHSNGAIIAREFYRKYPERTVGLGMVEGGLTSVIEDPVRIARFISALKESTYRAIVVPMFVRFSPPWYTKDQKKMVAHQALSTPQYVMVSTMEAGLDRANFRDDPIDVPLLVINVDAPIWDEAYVLYVESLAPELSYYVLPDVMHLLMLDQPEEFNEITIDFLDNYGL